MRYFRLALSLGVFCSACQSDEASPVASSEPTYWQDMAPLFEEHCLECHREGGIAPFRLDDYRTAKDFALPIRAATAARTMPPWGVTSDGSCGEFSDSLALSESQIARIAEWADAGAPEGVPGSITVPELPSLDGATELQTPLFVPEAAGGPLTESDEYRCFMSDSLVSDLQFISGYEIVPGVDSLVHHVLLMLVDPEAPAEVESPVPLSNLELMTALDAESPDREGWPCFGMAGEGVKVEAVPVTWAPGQGVVRYPEGSGVPLSPKHKMIVQVHYNLVNASNSGKADRTRIRLRLEPEVEKVGLFALVDPFLTSLFDEVPETLPPSRTSAPYTWQRTLKSLGLSGLPGVELHGIMPHMHELGRKYRFRADTDGSGFKCAADVQDWDFHWQRMYFYEEPLRMSETSTLEVTCDYDTSRRVEPVLPGWGTANEMCLATLYFTVPRSSLGL